MALQESAERAAFAKEYVRNSTNFNYVGEFPHTILSLCALYGFPSLLRFCVQEGANVDLDVKPRLCLHKEIHRRITHESYRDHKLETRGVLVSYESSGCCDTCGVVLFGDKKHQMVSQCHRPGSMKCDLVACENCIYFTQQYPRLSHRGSDNSRPIFKAVDIARRKAMINTTNIYHIQEL